MTLRITLATAARVLRQLRRDPRTLALLILVPIVLVTLLDWVFAGRPEVFDRIGVPLVGVFPLVSMFLVTSIAMLRERTSGTLERLLTLPLAKLDLLLGYALAFAVVAVVQASLVTAVAVGLLGLDVAGSLAWWWPSRSATRCSAWRSACSRAPSPPASSRPSSSCPPSCSRRSSSAA
jgi:ABC-2 type transport system permease protein